MLSLGARRAGAWRPIVIPAAFVATALALTSGRYGYHRDELYFIVAGSHPALGYPDQPLLTPLLARGMDLLDPGSLPVLRAPAVLASAITTATTALIARELGGSRSAQRLAACCWGVSGLCLVTGHFLTTTTCDVCATTVMSLLTIRALHRGGRWWLAAGAVLGVALLNKDLAGVVAGALLVALLLVGPRRALRSRWLVAGAIAAVLGALPYAIWQLRHGLPQEQLARSIARDGAQGGRAGFLPFQLLLVGPLLVPVWLAGLVALLRDLSLRPVRCFAVAYLVLIAFFLGTGGKAYYMAGLYPMLLATGALAVDGWVAGRAGRRLLLGGALAATAATSALIGLCLLPVDRLQGSPILAVNHDAGEMVGWPRLTRTVASVYRTVPSRERRRTAIFTENYGEAGAIAHFGPGDGLPAPYSAHNGWAQWGPPPDRDHVALLVGVPPVVSRANFTGCRVRARIDDGLGLENDEQGKAVELCAGERVSWSQLWPGLVHYD